MERRICLFIGKSGFGKTYLTRMMLLQEPRVLILDQRGEYAGKVYSDFDVLVNDLRPYEKNLRPFTAVWYADLRWYSSLCHLALALQNVTVVLEEADLYDCDGWYREAVYRGRMPGRVSLFGIAQRPHLLSPDLRSQATDIYAFNNSEDSALRWLSVCFGDFTDQIRALPPKTCLHYSIGADGEKITKIFLDKQIETIPQSDPNGQTPALVQA